MAKQYQWKTDAEIISGGYPGEPHGVINGSTDWHTTDTMYGSTSAEYYFRDSNIPNNENSSRVVVSITDSWTASIDGRNNLTVSLTTTVNSIVRDDVVGSPGNLGRDMFIRRESGGPLIWSIYNDLIRTEHTILGSPMILDSYTFTLAPGEYFSRGSIWFRSNTVGHDDTPPPSEFVDEMWLGTIFRNILPRDYRPGTILDTSIWRSHNRDGGKCHVFNGSGFQELRTVGGPTEAGDPPSIIHEDKWYNQRQIGLE